MDAPSNLFVLTAGFLSWKVLHVCIFFISFGTAAKAFAPDLGGIVGTTDSKIKNINAQYCHQLSSAKKLSMFVPVQVTVKLRTLPLSSHDGSHQRSLGTNILLYSV